MAVKTDSFEKSIHRLINSAKVSTKRNLGTNATMVHDSDIFRGLPLSIQDEITDMTNNELKTRIQAKGIKLKTLDSICKESEERMKKSVLPLIKGNNAAQVYDSFFNSASNVNTEYDPSTLGSTFPNLWLSPYEANSLYSQKGITETIINKKSKSILLNGVKIKNKYLTAKEIDLISENMVRLDFPKILSDANRDALVYGGSLVFPMFHKDNPNSAGIHIAGLIKNGIVGKHQIQRFITLDRWNTVHIPATNPTAKDWLSPEKYFIPFLGSDVHGTRCARIVTGEQAGYFGRIMTMGWGLSDFVGFMKSLTDYKNAVQTIPLMIQQMSLLARTVNIDGALATEGANIMEELAESNTIKFTDWSPTNPIQLDVLGEIQVINRQFQQVPELLRLLRQDAAADANVPEPMLWSSEKGNFSSGDDTQGNMAKQWESIKYVHKDVECNFKNMAKLIVLDALGVSKRILELLPYTEIHFDTPMIANSTERAEIGKNIAGTYFDLVSGQMPVHKAAVIASGYGGDELSIDSELLDELKQRQDDSDKKQEEKFNKEMELLDIQIETAKKQAEQIGKEPAQAPGVEIPKPKSEPKKYSRLEQEQHEKSRMPGEKRSEKLSKAENKRA